jgi:hypothetical protein
VPFILKMNYVAADVGGTLNVTVPAMYGGESATIGDEIFVWFSESSEGRGLAWAGRIDDCALEGKKISVAVRLQTEITGREFGARQLRLYRSAQDGGAKSGLSRKLYFQAHNKIAALSPAESSLLRGYFQERDPTRKPAGYPIAIVGPMICPTCGATDVAKASAIYEQGVTNVTGRTTGVGISPGGLGVGAARHKGQSVSLAAQKNSPPQGAGFLHGCAGMIAALLVVLVMTPIAAHSFGAFILEILLATAAAIAVGIYAYKRLGYGNIESALRRDYAKTWYCEKCGNQFLND